MLKKFFIAFMGSMAAIWLSGFLFIIGLIIAVGVAIGSLVGESEIKDHSILVIDLTGVINERETKPSIPEIITEDFDLKSPTLNSMLRAIRLAASDSDIDGIYIECGGSEMGYASRRELLEAINDFKKSGKWVYAYGDMYSQGDYFVASAATKIFVNPEGAVDIHGLASTVPFFKNALDKLGVEVQVFKVGEFKSAVEPFLLTQMSEPARLQTKVYIDSVWSEVSDIIAENRSIPASQVQNLADSMLMAQKTDVLTMNKLVDEVCYRRVFENKLRKLTKLDMDEDLRLVSPAEYLEANNISEDQPSKDEKHVAVLYAVGDIVDNGNEGIVATDIVPAIISLADDENVKGLVLRVNSGGGSAFASEQIWEALEYFKSKKKPFYVSMGDYAASGGYYISCGADKIYADAETLTGSIGIFGMIPCVNKLMNNHLGINFSTVSTNANAAFPQITSPMTTAQYSAMQKSVEDGYELFTSRVAEGRGIERSEVLKIAEGRIWDGRSALRLGLVDNIGSLNDAVAAMVKAARVENSQVIAYPEISFSTFEEMLLNTAGGSDNALSKAYNGLEIEGLSPREVRKCMGVVRRMMSCSPIQARMENVTIE